MSKEPEIKLFGRKISLPENGAKVAAGEFSGESSNGSGDGEESRGQEGEDVGKEEKQEQNDEDLAEGEVYETSAENDDQNQSNHTNSPSESDENPKTPPTDDDDQPKSENEENGATNSQQKTLKKPDKILPCPRCNSMDTKFCYYNNYNVNQPRHFCKSCQRYWTAGGTMRNVPVGAGRRKNKNSASHCGHITISEALHAARIDASNGFHNLKFKPNGTVLTFGPDSPCCEPMASALNLAERRAPNAAAANGYYKNGEKEKADDCSTGPSATMSNPPPMENGFQQPAMPLSMNGFPCIPGVPWPFPWNSAVPLPAIFPPGYPVPYYLWNTSGWNLPWVSPAASEKTAATSPTSPLGKHLRSDELLSSETAEGQRRKTSIVIPKTLRIDDPEEAARSSIWSTLGIKYDSMTSREGLFKAFQPKGGDAKKQAMAAAATTTTTSSLMQANPAALSRSVTFRETA